MYRKLRVDEASIEQFRKDLPLVMDCCGWSVKHLADLLGISLWTVRKFKNEGSMSRMQYLAIRMLLENEIIENRDPVLRSVLDILFDIPNIPERSKENVRRAIKEAAYGVCRNQGCIVVRAAVRKELATMFGGK